MVSATHSDMIGQSSRGTSLPAAITVIPGQADPDRTMLMMESTQIAAGQNLTAFATLFDAGGNQKLQEDSTLQDVVVGLVIVEDKSPISLPFEPELGKFKLTARLYAAGQYTLQVCTLYTASKHCLLLLNPGRLS